MVNQGKQKETGAESGHSAEQSSPGTSLLRIYKWWRRTALGVICLFVLLDVTAAWIVLRAIQSRVSDMPFPIWNVGFSSDGKYILTGGYCGVTFWDSANDTMLRRVGNSEINPLNANPTVCIPDLFLSPDDKYMLSHWGDWVDATTGGFVGKVKPGLGDQYPRGTYNLYSAAFSPDGKYIVTGASSGQEGNWTATLWDADRSKTVQVFYRDPATNARIGVAFSADGRSVLTISSDKPVTLWDISTGAMIRTFEGSIPEIHAVAFSPDSKRILNEGNGDLWDTESGKLLRQFAVKGVPNAISEFSPDGKSVLTYGADGVARFWDVETGALLRTFTIDDSPPIPENFLHVAFSPDGQSVLTVMNDGTAKLWDAETGAKLHTFGSSRSQGSMSTQKGDAERLVWMGFFTLCWFGMLLFFVGAAIRNRAPHDPSPTSQKIIPMGMVRFLIVAGIISLVGLIIFSVLLHL